MEKLVYLLFQRPDVPGNELRDGLLQKAAPELRAGGATRIAVNVHDDDATGAGDSTTERWEELPAQRWLSQPPVRAMVSFWLENSDDRAPCERALEPYAARLNGYLVVESIPLINEKHRVPVGQRTPGFNQVACIKKKRSLGEDEFYDIWLNDQKVVAIECQSSFGYKRNAVVRHLTPGARAFDGIVEESFPMEALRDRFAFYESSSEEEFQAKFQRMMNNVNRFLEMDEVETTPMSEYLLD